MDADELLRAHTRASVGQRVLKAARLLDARALARLAEQPGAPAVRPAHTRLFPHLDLRGVRVTELADRVRISKQAVSKLVGDLVAWRLVEQVSDPEDGRAARVRFTPAGMAGITRGLAQLGMFQAEVEARVGPERAAVFAEVLDVWIEVLESEPEDARR